MNKSRNLSRENYDDQYVLTTKKEALFSLFSIQKGNIERFFRIEKGRNDGFIVGRR
jgi:hypothetical protein